MTPGNWKFQTKLGIAIEVLALITDLVSFTYSSPMLYSHSPLLRYNRQWASDVSGLLYIDCMINHTWILITNYLPLLLPLLAASDAVESEPVSSHGPCPQAPQDSPRQTRSDWDCRRTHAHLPSTPHTWHEKHAPTLYNSHLNRRQLPLLPGPHHRVDQSRKCVSHTIV